MTTVDSRQLHAIARAIGAFDDAERVLSTVLRDGGVDAAALPAAEAAIERAFAVVERTPIMPWALHLPTPGPQRSGAVFMARRRIDAGRAALAPEQLRRATDAVHHARAGARQVLEGARLPISTADDLIERMSWVPSNPSLSATTTRLAWEDLPIEAKAAIVPDGDLRVDLRRSLHHIERGHAFETAFGTIDHADTAPDAGLDALAARVRLASTNHAERRAELARIVEAGEQLTRREAFEVEYLAATDSLHDRLAHATIEERRSIVAADLTLRPSDAWQRAWAELLPDQQAQLLPDPASRELFELLLDQLRGRSSSRFGQQRRLALELVTGTVLDDAAAILTRLRDDAAARIERSPAGRRALLERLVEPVRRSRRAGHEDALHAWALLSGDRVLDHLTPADHARAAGRIVAAHAALPEPSAEWTEGLRDGLEAALAATRDTRVTDPALAAVLDDVDELAQRNLDRLRGVREDGFGTHPDYAELGRVAESLELVARLGRSTDDAPVAARAAEALDW